VNVGATGAEIVALEEAAAAGGTEQIAAASTTPAATARAGVKREHRSMLYRRPS
jgi:hypothetical protein